MITSAVRITSALPPSFSDLDVARLLQAKGILTVPTGSIEENKNKNNSSSSSNSWSKNEVNSEKTVAQQRIEMGKEMEKRRQAQLNAAVDDWDLEDDEEEEEGKDD